MATTVLDLFEDAYYTYSIDLDNEVFNLTFRWNSRAGQWMMSIADSNGDDIILNIPLVPAYPLLSQFSLEKPVGEMFLLPLNKEEMYQPIPDPRHVYRTHFLIYDDLQDQEG